LPKPIRKHLVPAPDTDQAAATYLAEHANPKTDNFFDELGAFLRQVKPQYLKPDDWTVDNLPPHLRFSYQVIDERGAIVGASEDIARLQRELAGANQSGMAASPTTAAQSQGVALPSGKQPAPTEHEKTDSQPASSETASASTFQPKTSLTKWSIGDIPE